jgi:hypothetical protein
MKKKAPVKQSNKEKVKRRNPGQGLLSALGGIGGGYLGGPLGSVLGAKAGDLLSKITGFGAYTVNKNTLVSGNSVPTFRLSTDGVEISHREFISDIVGSVAFVNQNLNVNPGLSSTFPWLAQLATNFEEYEMLGLVFEYRPSSGSAVSNASAALGVVVYATDYNVLSPNFTNKQQMESYEYSCSTVPFEGMLHPVECANRANVLNTMYVRNSSVPAGADQRMYDLGNFEFATVGMQSAYTVGELWVSYHVRLKKPRISSAGPNDSNYAHIVELASGTAATASRLGTAANPTNRITTLSNLAGVIAVDPNKIILSNPGNYLVVGAFDGSINSIPGLGIGSNIVAGNAIFVDNTLSTFAIFSATGNAVGLWTLSVTAAGIGANNTITLTGLATFASGTSDVMIFDLPPSYN